MVQATDAGSFEIGEFENIGILYRKKAGYGAPLGQAT